MRRLAFLLCFVPMLLGPVHAVEARRYGGTVTSVVDGDTLWVRPAAGGAPVELRLHGVDAPEACQPWGPQARQALRRHLLAQRVSVQERARDAYGRRLARLAHDGQDVGAWLVANGLAWSTQWRGRRGPYDALQAQAMQARRGLWSQPDALEPRTFRKAHGSCRR